MTAKLVVKALCAVVLLCGALPAGAEELELLHYWTSGGESRAVNVLKEEIEQRGHVWKDSAPLDWDAEVARFFRVLEAFDRRLASDDPLGSSPERLFQGPVADALTHVGQMAMLRRMAGAPVRGENYFKADIAAGRVGPEQIAPRMEFT